MTTTTHPGSLRWAESVAVAGPADNRTVLVDVQLPGEESPREMELTVAAATVLRDMLSDAIEDEPATEFAVASPEWSEPLVRPSREFALNTVNAINSRGGSATLVTRKVIRTEWVEEQQ